MYRQCRKSSGKILKFTPGESTLFLKNCKEAEMLQVITFPVFNGTHYICNAIITEKFFAGGTQRPWKKGFRKETIWTKYSVFEPVHVELRFNTVKKRVQVIFPPTQ